MRDHNNSRRQSSLINKTISLRAYRHSCFICGKPYFMGPGQIPVYPGKYGLGLAGYELYVSGELDLSGVVSGKLQNAFPKLIEKLFNRCFCFTGS